ncbi:superoxide dismutase, Cu-Zn family [Amphiplicatus metriothermophilus]|uniref:Superoxide dismutase [Cu-Zn] n=2 Tax=Amphiplicatus metriothermophilus TaxID=1519374 RepID=A0A239PUN0_9PROT|nr:superoxide dismutase, Cu-Zn family [Amphiplicatus metriothermophilus]
MRPADCRLLALAAAAPALAACGGLQNEARPLLEELAPSGWADAEAAVVNAAGETVGRAVFAEAPGGVLMRIDVKGLSKGWHGVHFHQRGDCSDGPDGFKASGGHVGLGGNAHGLLNPEGSESGDLPNLYAAADGRVTVEVFRWGVSLYPSEANAAANGPEPLLDDDGFAVVIHAHPDDHETQPIGGAGERVACAAVTG